MRDASITVEGGPTVPFVVRGLIVCTERRLIVCTERRVGQAFGFDHLWC